MVPMQGRNVNSSAYLGWYALRQQHRSAPGVLTSPRRLRSPKGSCLPCPAT